MRLAIRQSIRDKLYSLKEPGSGRYFYGPSGLFRRINKPEITGRRKVEGVDAKSITGSRLARGHVLR